MARIANKYLPIHQIDPDNPNLFLAQLIGAKDFRRDILLRIITEEKEWNEQFLVAKRCAHLHHSNVLQVLDVGQHGDFWYIAYEFVEALTILEILQNKSPITIEHIVYIITEILKALNYAFRQQAEPVYHHNLSPDQILITKQGTIKIKGFGLSCSLEETSPYRHPHPKTDCAQDIFSIGTMLHHLCLLLPKPPQDLIRIAQQACSHDVNVQFQSINAMYDIITRRFPLSGTTSVDLAQNIILNSFSQWEEQPTFVSKTLTTKDTLIFMRDSLLKEKPEQHHIIEKNIVPEQAIEPKKTYPSHIWGILGFLVLLASLLIGFIVGQQFRPSPTFKLLLPPQFSLQANGKPFTKISEQPLDRPIELEVLHDSQSVLKTELSIIENQNLIILLPVEAKSLDQHP